MLMMDQIKTENCRIKKDRTNDYRIKGDQIDICSFVNLMIFNKLYV
jgi:hypothetical protein